MVYFEDYNLSKESIDCVLATIGEKVTGKMSKHGTKPCLPW